MNVYEKLNTARRDFHSLKLEKTGWNPYSEFKYFELSDFVIPALQIFADLKLCAVCSFTNELASMTITNVEKPDEQIVITAPFSSAKLKASHEIQNVGACETYHRRYFWIVALEIVEHDALDKTLGKETPKITGAQVKRDAFKELQPEVQDMLRKMVPRIVVQTTHKNIEGVQAIFQEAYDNFPDEDHNTIKLGLWSLLDSKTTSAISAVEKK
jgi:hypothetical protein